MKRSIAPVARAALSVARLRGKTRYLSFRERARSNRVSQFSLDSCHPILPAACASPIPCLLQDAKARVLKRQNSATRCASPSPDLAGGFCTDFLADAFEDALYNRF